MTKNSQTPDLTITRYLQVVKSKRRLKKSKGYKVTEIAEELGLNRITVYRALKAS